MRRACPRRSRAAGCGRRPSGPSPTAGLRDERDEVVEVGAVDRHRDAVGERDQAQPAVRVLRGAGREELLHRALRRAARGQLLDERRALVEAQLASGDLAPELLLVLVEELRVDALPLARDHDLAAEHVGCHRHEPRRRRQLAPRTALHAPARRRRDARALAVEVCVEQRVQRDDALVVRRGLRREVDDDARFLARMDAHDPADALLVDALRRGRREVHDDRRAR